MVEPWARKEAVDYVCASYDTGRKRACGLIGLSRSSYYYRSCQRDDQELREALKEAASRRRRWGYRRLQVLLRRAGFSDNHKRIYRIYREEQLQVPKRKRKKVSKYRGESISKPERVNQRWSMDFVHESTAGGQRFRMLNIMDDYSRECLWIEVASSLSGERVCRVLDNLSDLRGRPQTLLMDNGPEFTGKALDRWAYNNKVNLHYIEPGKPMQNP